MLRYKILGPDSFHKSTLTPPNYINNLHINRDLGNFSIGTQDHFETIFEDVPIPPQQLWVKVQVEFSAYGDIPVLKTQEEPSFAWDTAGFCQKVSLIPKTIIYAQKDSLVAQNWQLQPCIFEHQFAVAPTIYADTQEATINLWPCGGRVSRNLFEIEQLYAQAPVGGNEAKMYVNSLSTLKKHLNDSFVFQPPEPQALSLAAAITAGRMTLNIADDDLNYIYTSSVFEKSNHDDQCIQILFARKDQ